MRVMICDDHPIVAAAMGMTIESLFGAAVEITDCCARALELASEAGPFDLMLFDLHIPHEDPAANLRAVRAAYPDMPIVVFSGSEDAAHLRLALELDVRGFIPKSARPEVIEAALRLVLAGGRYLPDPVRMMALAVATGEHRHGESPGVPSERDLTDRQIEVLRMLAGGAENKQIARALGISPYTVKAHVAQLLQLLGASNRTQAVDIARRQGVL